MKRIKIDFVVPRGVEKVGDLVLHDTVPPGSIYVGNKLPYALFRTDWLEGMDSPEAEADLTYRFVGYERKRPYLSDEQHGRLMHTAASGHDCLVLGTTINFPALVELFGNKARKRADVTVTLLNPAAHTIEFSDLPSGVGHIVGYMTAGADSYLIRWYVQWGDGKYRYVNEWNACTSITDLARFADWKHLFYVSADGTREEGFLVVLHDDALPGAPAIDTETHNHV